MADKHLIHLSGLGVSKRRLADCLAPVRVDAETPAKTSREFGWVRGIAAPSRGDYYLVEFHGEKQAEIVAYLDRYGRAFSTDTVVVAPPACAPDLMLVPDAQEPQDKRRDPSHGSGEGGTVYARNGDGPLRKLARFVREKNRYRVSDTWYRFPESVADISYPDFIAYLYAAFVYRPKLTGMPVPSSGLVSVTDLIRAGNVVRGLRAVRMLLAAAEEDPVLHAPDLARFFAVWLGEAGFSEAVAEEWLLGAFSDDYAGPLRLIRTKPYANTFYLSNMDENVVIPERTIVKIEAALNRFLLAQDHLGAHAAQANELECIRTDEMIREQFAIQAPDIESEQKQTTSEWKLRFALSTAIESLRTPYRIDTIFQADLSAGIVAFSLMAPDSDMMPPMRFDRELGKWLPCDDAMRQAAAFRYAAHAGIALAAFAFQASSNIEQVSVFARPFAEHGEDVLSEKVGEGAADPFYMVVFTREGFTADGAYRKASLDDPTAFFKACGARQGKAARPIAPFGLLEKLPNARKRVREPELEHRALSLNAALSLGAVSTDDLRIDYGAVVREEGRALAANLRVQPTVQEATRIVLQWREQTENPLVYEACTRLMTGLTQGSVNAADSEAVENCFAGLDTYARAHEQANQLMLTNQAEAGNVLRKAIAEAESTGRYRDTPETVHRMFDNYVARVLYNLCDFDEGRKVDLAPTSLFLCYFDALNLLDGSFTDSEEAVRYGRRCIEIAPTFTPAYRRCARAYMLVGDLESAADLLKQALAIALIPEEIAAAYYQLAYVLWRSKKPKAGIACYLKSILTSTAYMAQATMELHELLSEEGVPMIQRDEVDETLMAAGIPLAPASALLDDMDRALHAAVDEGLFPVARALLTLVAIHRPDDALTNVLHSLEVQNFR